MCHSLKIACRCGDDEKAAYDDDGDDDDGDDDDGDDDGGDDGGDDDNHDQKTPKSLDGDSGLG